MECSCFGLKRVRSGERRTPIAGERPTFFTMNLNANNASPAVVYVSGSAISTLQESHGRRATKDASALFLAALAAMVAVIPAALVSAHNLSVDHHSRHVKNAMTSVARAVIASGLSIVKFSA